MRLFSAPGSSLNHKRAWLMTTPFDRALDSAVPPVIMVLLNVRLGTHNRMAVDLAASADLSVRLSGAVRQQ